MREGLSSGEELLLAVSPVFKRRYTHDGDLVLGCHYGTLHCYGSPELLPQKAQPPPPSYQPSYPQEISR
jgi:hypothetical protein